MILHVGHFGMNDVLMFEAGLVLQSCNFLTMLSEAYSASVLAICASTNLFYFFYLI